MKKGSIASTILTAILIISLAASEASASGFGTYSNNAEAVALGGAFIARASGANAIFYNPAALIIDSKVSVTTTIYSSITDITIGGSSNENTQLTNVSGAVSVPITSWFALGVGYFPLMEISNTLTELKRLPIIGFGAEFDVKILRAAAAIKITDNVSLGIGFDTYGAEMNIVSEFIHVPLLIAQNSQRLEDLTGSASGFSAGLLARLNDNFTFGASYRSEAELDLDGFLRSPITTESTVSMKMPSDLGVGLYFAANDRFTASFDLHQISWSSMEDSIISSKYFQFPLAKSWEDTTTIHIGAEYKLNKYVNLRGGFANIPSPIAQESFTLLFPYSDQRDFTLGVAVNTTAYKTGVKEALGGIGAYATLVFSQYDDLNVSSIETYTIQFDEPFVDLTPPGATYNVSGNLFTILLGFSFTLN